MMRNRIAVVLAGLLFFAGFLALSGALQGSTGAAAVLCASVAGIAGLFWLDARRARAAHDKTAGREQDQLERTLASADDPRFELTVFQSPLGLLAAGVVMLGFAAVPLSGVIAEGASVARRIAPALFAALLVPGGLLACWAALSRWGRPVVVLSRAGFETSWSGLVPWEKVHGIFLRDDTTRAPRIRRLELNVPDLESLRPRFRLPFRWIYRLRPRSWAPLVGIPLRSASVPPEVVYRTARSLWTRCTGRDHDWGPGMSAEFNLALRRAGEARRFLGELRRTQVELDPHRHEVDRVVRQLDDMNAVIATELRRRTRRSKRVFLATLAIVLVWVVASLVKRLG